MLSYKYKNEACDIANKFNVPKRKVMKMLRNGMSIEEIDKKLTREKNINFLKYGEKCLGKDYQFARYSEHFGDFSSLSDREVEELAEELDWLWK